MRVRSSLLLVSILAACSSPAHSVSPDPTVPSDPEIDGDGDGHDTVADCDDDDDDVFPGASEVPYDGVDQDCAGGDLVDVDADGADAIEAGGDDCDDADPAVFPGATDIAYDTVDQDCADGDLVDVDGDGFDAIEAGGDDCDDADADTAPGALDRADDGVDQSCDGVDGMDGDLDGFASLQSFGDDCDDADQTVNPAALEVWYDGLDQDCDGACDGDQDGDGSVVDGWGGGIGCDPLAPSDCDDTNPLAEAELVSTSPVDGAVGTSALREVRATLFAYDATAVLDLVDSDGVAVDGITTWSGSTLVFDADAPLALLTTHTATLTWGCGTEVWSFTTGDGTGQEIVSAWTFGAPDQLTIDILNPVATEYAFGMAETAAGIFGWYGEDCAGALASGDCHPMSAPSLVLDSVYPDLLAVEPGFTTLFDATFDTAITYYVEARDGVEQGSCWTWGHEPAYFSFCTAL